MNNKSQRNQHQVEKFEKIVSETVLASTVADFSEIPDELHDISNLLEQVEQQKNESSKKPTIDGLLDAFSIIDDVIVFNPEVETKIVVEMNNIHVKSNCWLFTRVYTVKEIDQETGNLKLWDDGRIQWAGANFKYAANFPNVIKIKVMPKNRTSIPEGGFPVKSNQHKEHVKEELPKVKSTSGKRGRPAGSKNRPKDVVKAEKNERIKQRVKKAEMRAKKKHTK